MFMPYSGFWILSREYPEYTCQVLLPRYEKLDINIGDQHHNLLSDKRIKDSKLYYEGPLLAQQ